MLTGKMLTFTYAYNQTQSTDVFIHIESNAKLHENCIFFVFLSSFLLVIFILYKNYSFLLFVIVLLQSFSSFNDNFNNVSIKTRHNRCKRISTNEYRSAKLIM